MVHVMCFEHRVAGADANPYLAMAAPVYRMSLRGKSVLARLDRNSVTQLAPRPIVGAQATGYAAAGIIWLAVGDHRTKEFEAMKIRLPLLLLALLAAAPSWADATDEKCQATLEIFRRLGNTPVFLADSYGYAVFPTIGKGGIGIGGAYGTGCVYRGGAKTGTASMGQVTIGFQLGGQAFSELIVFQSKAAYDVFTTGSFEFGAGAGASAVALTYGAQAGTGTTGSSASAGSTKGTGGWYRGMAMFMLAKGGLMYEASIGGQKFNFKPIGSKQ